MLVSHDAEFVDALAPHLALLLPDGTLDYWNNDLLDLVPLAKPQPALYSARARIDNFGAPNQMTATTSSSTSSSAIHSEAIADERVSGQGRGRRWSAPRNRRRPKWFGAVTVEVWD